MRYAACILLAGCTSILGGPTAWYNWREPMDPPPAAWYADVEACWGVTGDFDAIRWYRGDLEHRDLAMTVGEIVQGDEITVAVGNEHRERIIKHAMSHHVRPELGNSIHYDGSARAICDDA